VIVSLIAHMPNRRQNRGRARNPGTPRRRRPARTGDIVTVNRSEYIGAFPASSGAFTSATLSVYPGSPAISPIAQLYTEYRFVRYSLRIVPRASTSTLGTIFVAFRGAPPTGAPVSLAAAATLARFRTRGAGHEGEFVASLDCRTALRPWLRYVSEPTSAQLLDPDFVQAWLVIGSDSVQSGVIPADLHVSYTVRFRSSADLPGAVVSDEFVVQTTLL